MQKLTPKPQATATSERNGTGAKHMRQERGDGDEDTQMDAARLRSIECRQERRQCKREREREVTKSNQGVCKRAAGKNIRLRVLPDSTRGMMVKSGKGYHNYRAELQRVSVTGSLRMRLGTERRGTSCGYPKER